MRELDIGKNDAGQRFDKYLKKLLKEAPGSFIYKMMRKKNIVLNGKKADGTEKLQEGDKIKLFLSDETYEKFTGLSAGSRPAILDEIETIPRTHLEIVYEDDDILVINKPAGMLSQKARPTDISANEYILRYLYDNGSIDDKQLMTFRPSICNRLDRNTSGLLVAGKTLRGLQRMSEELKQRDLKKYYICLVNGTMKKGGISQGYLLKNEAENRVEILSNEVEGSQYIRTGYEPVKYLAGGFTLVKVHLITGRSHQIRAHLAALGYSIVGDSKYGSNEVNQYVRRAAGLRRQFLHAQEMQFPDGRKFYAELPKDLDKTLSVLSERSM